MDQRSPPCRGKQNATKTARAEGSTTMAMPCVSLLILQASQGEPPFAVVAHVDFEVLHRPTNDFSRGTIWEADVVTWLWAWGAGFRIRFVAVVWLLVAAFQHCSHGGGLWTKAMAFPAELLHESDA